jgi:hypothetical protein
MTLKKLTHECVTSLSFLHKIKAAGCEAIPFLLQDNEVIRYLNVIYLLSLFKWLSSYIKRRENVYSDANFRAGITVLHALGMKDLTEG